ncbi:MAG: hypothetical protein WCR72_13345 [Bacteroidota bacterium]
METVLIYLEGKNDPFTNVELAEMILQESKGKDEDTFSAFKAEYEDLDFRLLNKEDKQKRLLTDFKKLKSEYQRYSSWGNPDHIKNDIAVMIVPLHVDKDNRLIIPERLWNINIENAVNLNLAIKKRNYINGLLEDLMKETLPGAKIKWNRSVSEFGFLMIQLVEKGYLELPLGHTTEGSYLQLARILFKSFDVTDSWESFKDALYPNKNTLGNFKRAKFDDFPKDFPDANDLGKIKNQRYK